MDGDDLTFCRLCLDLLKEPRQLPCFHSFCLNCLLNGELNDDDEPHCPVCSSPFEMDSENIQNLKIDRFVQRLVMENKSQSEDFCYERFCDNHPSAKINFFCVDCEVSGCPICSTGKHDNHRCIDLNEMGNVIRDELKNMSRDLKANLSWQNVQFNKEKQSEEERQKRFLEVSKEIVDRGEIIKKAIDRQIENLLKQVEAVKRRSLKDNEGFTKKSKNMMENVMLSFISYIDKLAMYGLPEELIESVRVIKTRTDHLKHASICCSNANKMEVNFIPSSVHIDSLSLIGHVEIIKSKTSLDAKRDNKLVAHVNNLSITSNETSLDDEKRNILQTKQNCSNKVSLRMIPECHLVHSLRIGKNVAAVAVGRDDIFVAVEHTGDILRYNSEIPSVRINHEMIKIDGLETPWDMTAISNDEMSTTYLFVVDNLQGKLFQVGIPYGSKMDPIKFVRKVWTLELNESVTLSSSADKLLLASTANKIIEYSLSSLLITSLSSSSTSVLQLPEPAAQFSVIPHMSDILHASRISEERLVAFFDHLYSLSGGFLVNSWGKMISSFGEGRGEIASRQIDYPSHVAIDRKENADDEDEDLLHKNSNAVNSYNDEAFIFLCDNGNDRITLFDGDLKYLKVAVEKVEQPWRLALDQRKKILYVSTLQQSLKIFKY